MKLTPILTSLLVATATPAIAHHNHHEVPRQWQQVCTQDYVNLRMPFAQQPVHEGRVVQVLPPGMCIMQFEAPDEYYWHKFNFAQKSGNYIPLFSLDGFLGYVSADYTYVQEFVD